MSGTIARAIMIMIVLLECDNIVAGGNIKWELKFIVFTSPDGLSPLSSLTSPHFQAKCTRNNVINPFMDLQ
jgi:hypothetical protein